MCRMCSTDNEPDSITDDRPEHEPERVAVYIADNGTHAFTINVTYCIAQLVPYFVAIAFTFVDTKCESECVAVCVADVVS
jgi:hypothetical protein